MNKDSDPPVPAPDKAPEGYIWHHHEDGTTMILVEKDIHREFTHSGEYLKVNGKNRQQGGEPVGKYRPYRLP
ncbi:HNH endonuclease [Paenibacillus sp. SEL1]|uniref:HNH endonuclease n=1 Tax=Paenibacillus polymyxa TaxID=1406 RepID=UPI0039FBBAF1